jgi:aminoglycoside phosphotransferase
MKRFSLLELLHPDGSASSSFVLGSNCPESLFPEPRIESDQKVALLVLAPSAKECQSEGWLNDAVNVVHHRLSDDGVCYLLLPLPWRLKIIRLLSRTNLVIDSSFWHFPDLASSQYLVPLQRGPFQFMVENIISAPLWKRILGREIFRYSSAGRLLGSFWKSAGISVRRPAARPLFQWLFKREPEEFSLGTAILRRSWRGFRGASILYCFSESDSLSSAIAKTTLIENPSVCLDHESEVLEALGPGIRSAGAQVPQVLLKEHNDQRSSLLLSAIRGRPASDLLASNSDLLSPILTKIVSWLERWHIVTVHVRLLDEEQFEKDFFAPLERLAPFLQNAEAYQDWLADRIRAAVGNSFPFVATHNDLTMANVLVDEQDLLGVVDWETGMAENWPLVDFYYAVTDAIRIAQGYRDWLEAFRACYQPDGPYALQIACWEERLQSALELPSGLAELCFHACWLHHASNEHRVSHPGAPRPFLKIVQRLALYYSKTNQNHN